MNVASIRLEGCRNEMVERARRRGGVARELTIGPATARRERARQPWGGARGVTAGSARAHDAPPQVHVAVGADARLHRTRLRRRAARQSLSADDREGGARHARHGVAGRLPLLRHRAALRPRPVGDAAQRFPARQAARRLSVVDQGRPSAAIVPAGGADAAGRFLRDAVASRSVRLFLRRRDALARILAGAARPRPHRHRLRP